MKEPLEYRLSQMPLHRAPAHWRAAILAKAQALPQKHPPSARGGLSAHWVALAAAWVLIALLQWDSNRGSVSMTDSLPVIHYIPSLSAFRNPEAYLEELLAEPLSLPPTQKQSRCTSDNAANIA